MASLRLIYAFLRASLQQETAYRANFFISLLHSLLSLGTGLLGIWILFGEVDQFHGWDLAGVLALLGVYQLMLALRGLFIGPSLDALAGLEGEVWRGKFDFTLLRPVDTQFLASFRHWRLFSLFDLALGLGVLGVAVTRPGQVLTVENILAFGLALCAGVVVLYAVLLALAALVFWSPGLLFTWVFDGIFQLGRYPVGIYPGWLRLVLTWVIPVGIMTTVPAQALIGAASGWVLLGSACLAILAAGGASLFFRFALRRYSSASS